MDEAVGLDSGGLCVEMRHVRSCLLLLTKRGGRGMADGLDRVWGIWMAAGGGCLGDCWGVGGVGAEYCGGASADG